MNYSNAAVVGAVSGLRVFSAPALIAERMASPRIARIAEAIAVGELIADKLPFMPDRTQPAVLTFRALTGAACGYALASSRKRSNESDRWISAAVAAAAALAGAYAGMQFRKRIKLPRMLAAMVEDAVAVGAGAMAAAAIGR